MIDTGLNATLLRVQLSCGHFALVCQHNLFNPDCKQLHTLEGYVLLLVHVQCCSNEIRSREVGLRPAPVRISVFAGLGLHSARRGIHSLARISLSSTAYQ